MAQNCHHFPLALAAWPPDGTRQQLSASHAFSRHAETRHVRAFRVQVLSFKSRPHGRRVWEFRSPDGNLKPGLLSSGLWEYSEFHGRRISGQSRLLPCVVFLYAERANEHGSLLAAVAHEASTFLPPVWLVSRCCFLWKHRAGSSTMADLLHQPERTAPHA